MIFFTKNITQNLVAFIMFTFSDKSHCNSSNHFFHRNTSCKHRKTATASRSLRRRTVRFHNFRNNTNSVWEFFAAWNHRSQRTASKISVTNFTTTSCEFSSFTYRIWREVIMENKVFTSVPVNIIISLFIHCSTQSTNCKRLSFTASEQSRTMRHRQNIDFAGNRTDFIALTTINTHTVIKNRLSQKFILNIIH